MPYRIQTSFHSRSDPMKRTCAAALALFCIVVGCRNSESGTSIAIASERQIAPGVVVRTILAGGIAGESGAAIIDIDLATAPVRPTVVAENVKVEKGRVY